MEEKAQVSVTPTVAAKPLGITPKTAGSPPPPIPTPVQRGQLPSVKGDATSTTIAEESNTAYPSAQPGAAPVPAPTAGPLPTPTRAVRVRDEEDGEGGPPNPRPGDRPVAGGK